MADGADRPAMAGGEGASGVGEDGAHPVPFDGGVLAHLPSGPDLLVALDIDGTLLSHDGALSDGVREMVGQVRDSGAQIVLSTGRAIPAVTPVLDALGLESGWVVCSNGAVTARLDPSRPAGYELTEVVTFDPEPTLRSLRQNLPDGLFAVEDVGHGFKVSAPFPDGELLGRVQVVDFEDLCAEPAARVTLRAPDLSSADFHDLVDRTGLHGVSYAVGWTAWLDINPEGVTKASALEQVRRELGVDPNASLAVGDGRNDIEMLRWAAVGVAMGGADAQTRAAADAATAGVEHDGVVPVLGALAAARR